MTPHIELSLAKARKHFIAGRLDKADSLLRAVLTDMPDCTEALEGLALVATKKGAYPRALHALERLIAIHPQLAEAHYGKGCVLGMMGRFDDELAAYQSAIALQPNFAQAYVNMGVALRDLHRFDEALQQFASAIDIDPNYAAARTNRAQTNLLLGHFSAGWSEYEWRWLDGGTPHGFDPQKQWTGEQPIAGKTVLAHAEQGMGDTLQFVRYVEQLAREGARVVLRVQSALLPLLREYPGTAQVIGENDAVPDFDWHCPLLSLPLAFKTDATNIPAAIPYLSADPQQIAHWREIVGGATRRPRVGIAWAGLRTPSEHGNRSMRLAELAPLLATNAHFVSLQKDVPHVDRPLLRKLDSLLDVSHRLRTFADTAALISQLDLVISVDTSVAHLAGGLGAPVWIALLFTPDWRWQMKRTDSPWYPHARLFRQSVRGDWKDVIDRLTRGVEEWSELGQVKSRTESRVVPIVS
ncbi:MAG TPA: tetratricopeptide repeat protein [Burkholderiaceae bacterium]|nr:tetratricopeptide repeat protein [Burkholderiaceae bacterium]